MKQTGSPQTRKRTDPKKKKHAKSRSGKNIRVLSEQEVAELEEAALYDEWLFYWLYIRDGDDDDSSASDHRSTRQNKSASEDPAFRQAEKEQFEEILLLDDITCCMAEELEALESLWLPWQDLPVDQWQIDIWDESMDRYPDFVRDSMNLHLPPKTALKPDPGSIERLCLYLRFLLEKLHCFAWESPCLGDLWPETDSDPYLLWVKHCLQTDLSPDLEKKLIRDARAIRVFESRLEAVGLIEEHFDGFGSWLNCQRLRTEIGEMKKELSKKEREEACLTTGVSACEMDRF